MQRARFMVRLSFDPHDALGDFREALENGRVVPRDDESESRRKASNPLLCLQVGGGVQRLRDRRTLLDVLVEVDIVGGEDRSAGRGLRGDVLRCPSVSSTGVAANTWERLLRVPIDEPDASCQIGTDERQHVFFHHPAMCALRVPRLAGVVAVLIALDPDGCPRKQVDAADVVPVRMGDDDVGDVAGVDARSLDGSGRRTESLYLPLPNEGVTMKT